MKKIKRIILLLLALISLTACQLQLTSPAPAATVPQVSQKMPENLAQVTEASQLKVVKLLNLAGPTEELDQALAELIKAGLLEKKRNINLAAALAEYSIKVNEVEDLIEHIHDLYSVIYLDNPQYFYLNGSLQIHYAVSQQDQAEGFQLEPLYWTEYAGMTLDELDQVSGQLMAKVEQISSQIRQQSSQPRQQLILAHDWLVQNLAYDETANQNNNHAASALLSGKTLCQGYAQAYALIGRALGHDVKLICGKAGQLGHVWNQVVLDGQAYHVDVTHDDPTPDKGPDAPVRHVHLFRSDTSMGQTHQWQRENYLACPVDGAFYYRDQQLLAANQAQLEAALQQFMQGYNTGSRQLELLLEANFAITNEQLEDLLIEAIRQQLAGRTVFYRASREKDVALFQICDER